MTDGHRKKIEKIIGQLTCPKNFRCVESDVERLCEARDVGLADHLECLEPVPTDCPFALRLDDGCLCRCPLRVYLAKELAE